MERGERWLEHADEFFRFAGYSDEICPRAVRHTGWFVDSEEDETARGVVYRLPHKRGLLIGVYFSYADEHDVLLDFNARYDADDEIGAAISADSWAESRAEDARINAEAWQDGNSWRDARDEIVEARKDALKLLAEPRKNLTPEVAVAVRAQVTQYRTTIREARERQERLIEQWGEDNAEFNEGRGFEP